MSNFLNFLVIGLGVGATYSLLAAGVVLIYRGSGVVNFAQGSMGVVGVAAYYQLRSAGAVIAIVAALAAGSVFGALVQWVVMRRMRHSSPVTRMIATLALATCIIGAALLIYGPNPLFVSGFLPPGGWSLGGIHFIYSQLCLLGVGCAVTFFLWHIFSHMRWALATTAASENEQHASAQGWSPNLLAGINWALGGFLAALAGILLVPLTDFSPDSLYLSVLPAIAACVAGAWSFPWVFGAALAVGVLESEATSYISAPGWSDAVPFLFILAVLLFRGQSLPLRSYVADRLPRLGSGRISTGFVVVALALVGASIELFAPQWSIAVSATALAGLIGLSLVVLVGYCGQVSLAQYGIAGVAALVTGQFASHGVPFLVALILGIICTLPVGILIALPAVRTRGVTLAVVTLAFGTVIASVVLSNPSLTGGLISGLQIPSPRLFGLSFDPLFDPRNFSYLCVAALVAGGIASANLRRSRSGLTMIAVRDNERAAASVGVNVAAVKLYAFAVSTMLASLAGGLFALSSQRVDLTPFTPLASITVLLLTVIGGLGFIMGGVIGAAGTVGAVVYYLLFRYLNNNDWFPLAAAVLTFPIIMFKPDGVAIDSVVFAARVRRARDQLVHLMQVRSSRRRVTEIVRRDEEHSAEPISDDGSTSGLAGEDGLAPLEEDRMFPDAYHEARMEQSLRKTRATKQLIARDLVVSFGSVLAVDHFDLDVSPGEVVGLIGPNGAGKTTVIDAITGYVGLKDGSIELGEDRIEGWRAHARARAGISRSFQSVELFDDLSVRENIVLGDGLVPGVMRRGLDLLRPPQIRLAPWVEATVRDFGLQSMLDKSPHELSNASRRIVAIARAIASRPSVVLLDEPAAGLDAISMDRLGALIQHLAHTRDVGILLVEHNISMVLSACDRIVAMDFGRQIASGAPEEIRIDPAVVTAYLGTVSDAKMPLGSRPITSSDMPPWSIS